MAKRPTSGARSAQRGGTSKASGGAVATTIAAPEPAAPKKRTNPAQFAREVRAEARKITWTSRKETWITSVMVFIMVAIATLFFWGVDAILGWGVSRFITLGR